jgi:hypothetical protein
MKNVMDAVNCHRRALTDQVEDAFDAQQILPGALSQPGEPRGDSVPGKRLIAGETTGADVGAVSMIAVIGIAVSMSAVPMSAVPMSAVPMSAVPMSAVPMSAVPMSAVPMSVSSVRALVDPATDIDAFARWIEQCRAKQRIRRDLAV